MKNTTDFVSQLPKTTLVVPMPKVKPPRVPGQIPWIAVTDRVPDDRRKILTWGRFGVAVVAAERTGFLGVTKYNRTDETFDCEHNPPIRFNILGFWRKVTHWAEIEGPTTP